MNFRHSGRRILARTVATCVLVATSVFTATTSAMAQQTVVLPAVADRVPGLNGSEWSTEVQIIKISPADKIIVRRLWVCLEAGGFEENPADQLAWEMEQTDRTGRILVLTGANLLEGTSATLGAVALGIEGGAVIATARIANVALGTEIEGSVYGQGQQITIPDEPIVGPSFLPWIGGDSRRYGGTWLYYRNNLGFVNPNPTPLTVFGTVIPFDATNELETTEGMPETITVSIPPYGWKQFTWNSEATYPDVPWGYTVVPTAGYVVGLDPDSDNAYYAYASVVFAPDPETDVQAFNDPLFVPARSGEIVASE